MREADLFHGRGGVEPGLHVLEAVQEHLVVCDSFFEELFDQEQFGTVDDGVNALLNRLHRCERLKRFANENERRMPTLAHGHALNRLEREILLKIVGGKPFFNHHDLITHLAESHEEVAVGGGGVNFVTEFLKRLFDFFQPFRRGKRNQSRFVRRTEKFKLIAHNLFNLETDGGRGRTAIETAGIH